MSLEQDPLPEEDLTWSSEKDLLTETILYKGVEYPTWIYERACRLRERIPTDQNGEEKDLDSALRVVLRNVKAEKNSKPSNPDDPLFFIIR